MLPQEMIGEAINRFINDLKESASKEGESGWAPSTFANRRLNVTFDESAWREGKVQVSTLQRAMEMLHAYRERGNVDGI